MAPNPETQPMLDDALASTTPTHELVAVPGFPGYFARRDGAMFSTLRLGPDPIHHRSRPISMKRVGQGVGGGGYRVLVMRVAGKPQYMKLHNAIAMTFLGPRPQGCHTRHLDGNPLNNAVENLAYGSPQENAGDAVRHGRRGKADRRTYQFGQWDVAFARTWYALRYGIYAIAHSYGSSHMRIRRLIHEGR